MTEAMSAAERLGTGKYVLLTTYRRNGTAVATPVWVAQDGAVLVMISAADAGKVKRIRNNATVTVAPCTIRGKPRGLAVAGRATVIDGAGGERIQQLIRKKYWFTGRLVAVLSRLRRRRPGSVGLRIDVG